MATVGVRTHGPPPWSSTVSRTSEGEDVVFDHRSCGRTGRQRARLIPAIGTPLSFVLDVRRVREPPREWGFVHGTCARLWGPAVCAVPLPLVCVGHGRLSPLVRMA